MTNDDAVSPPAVERPTPKEVFVLLRARERRLSRLLVLYIGTGLAFMLLPGTFLGVWNLVAISAREAPQSVSPAWLQAHGHAQIFGWIGSFILGIGFHSIRTSRRAAAPGIAAAWFSWACWTAGVALRWVANVYGWHWRVALPLSAGLELAAFLVFFRTVSAHERTDGDARSPLDAWVVIVVAATSMFLLALLVNAAGALYAAAAQDSPAFPPAFDERFLHLETWGFLVPFVWGFSARWLPVFLGLRPTGNRRLLFAVGLNVVAAACALAGWTPVAAALVLGASVLAPAALGLFRPPVAPPKTRGVHASFPVFVRVAYSWAILAALLGAWAAASASPVGIWGASRHALTVGFLAAMVFGIGPRILPAFSGGRVLFSPRLMLWALVLLNLGCTVRVGAEVVAYRRLVAWAWPLLPASAGVELTAVTLFAANLALTFAARRVSPPAAG
jgi:uncharacterized protein involved in response to NO